MSTELHSASCYDRFRDAIIVESDEIKKFVGLLTDYIGEVDVKITCKDGTSHNLNSVDELLNHENPESKEIQSIEFKAYSRDNHKLATIEFSSVAYLSTVSFYYNMKHNVLYELRDKIQDIFAGMKTWYNFLYNISYFHIIIFFTITSAGIIYLFYPSYLLQKPTPYPSVDFLIIALRSCFIISFLGLVLSYPINKLRDKLFPRIFFLIGQGKKRYQRLCCIRRLVGTVFVGILGLITKLLF